MFRETDKAAAAFTAYGIKENDNVSVCMPAVPEIIYIILALNKIGANAALLNPTFTEQQLIDRINETEATLLLTINEIYPQLENVVPKTSIKTVVCFPAVNALGPIVKLIKGTYRIAGTLTWNDFIKAGNGVTAKEAEYKPDRSAIMVFSSGSTGASKGIIHTNSSLNHAITENAPSAWEFKRGLRYFTQIPVWFSTGIITTGLVPLFYGIQVILEPFYDFEVFKRHIKKYKPNYMITATGLVESLMSDSNVPEYGRNWIILAIGGEYAAPEFEKRCNAWLKTCGNSRSLQKGYGMCELSGSVVIALKECNKIGAAGIPTPHVTVAAFDIETDSELKYGERGELRVNTPCRMKGYFKKPEETAKYFKTDENGIVWACTGDMGYVTEDGPVFVSGRISDSYVNQAGETIYLFDIERAILDISEVRQCKAVVSEIDGENVHVCHMVLSGQSDSDAVLSNIMTHCAEILSENHMPSLFKVYDGALPVAPSGKLDTQKMRMDTGNLIVCRVSNR